MRREKEISLKRERELRREREGLNEGKREAKRLGEEGKDGCYRSSPKNMVERERQKAWGERKGEGKERERERERGF